MELEGAIVTIDAAGCYSDVVEETVEAGADYVIALKENQRTLQRDTEALFEKLEGVGRLPESCKTVDGGHDRVEVRRCWALDAEDASIRGLQKWPRLSSVCKVRAERHHPDGTRWDDPNRRVAVYLQSGGRSGATSTDGSSALARGEQVALDVGHGLRRRR